MNLARPDWEERIRAGRSLLPDFELVNPDLAARAVQCFGQLRLPDVIGKPLLKEAAGDWFVEIVRAIFGSLAPISYERLIREIFVLVPKKNSKTTYAAALMLAAVLLSPRPNAEFLIVAPTKEVANLSFLQAAGMVQADKVLFSRFNIQQHLKIMTYRPTGSRLMIKAFSPDVMTGVKPAGILIDELHVIAMNSAAESVMGQIRGGMISQPEAFLLSITTQSDHPPRGVFLSDLTIARAVRDGKSERQDLLPIVYEFPPDIQKSATLPGQAAPWEDASLWPMVLPNLGRSIHIKRLEQDFEAAREKGIEEVARWASQHLNVQIGMALRSDRWIGADYWPGQAVPEMALEDLLTRSEVVVAGIDGGGLDDLLALSVLGRDHVTQEWLSWSKSWVFEGVLEIRKKEASQLKDFAREGDLVIVSEPGQDIEQLADLLKNIDATLPLSVVGLDPMGVGAIVDALAIRGIVNDRVVGISQGWQLTGAIKTAARKLADGSLLHCDQQIMGWAVSNAKVEPRGNAIIITKQASGYLKIDPLMALFNAVTLMSRNPSPIQTKGDVSDFLECGIIAV